MAQTTTNTKNCNVLMMPDYRDINPYQELLLQSLAAENATVVFTTGYRRLLPIYRQVKALENCDVLHIHWIDPYIKGNNWFIKLIYCLKFLFDVFLVKQSSIRVIWTVHNLTAHNSNFTGLQIWVKQQFMKIADQIIIHSESAKKALLTTFPNAPQDKLNVIPHGHYRDIYSPAIAKDIAREKLGLPKQGLIFLNFGVLKPYKGTEQLLEVWQEDIDSQSDYYLQIVGKALDADYGMSLQAKVDQIETVTLNNEYISDEEIPVYFSAVDAVILPFQRILTSGSLLLAMSYSKPIIAPDFAGIKETLGSADDFLYDSEQDDGLSTMIQAVQSKDLTLASQKVKTACDNLDWQAIAQKTKHLYQP